MTQSFTRLCCIALFPLFFCDEVCNLSMLLLIFIANLIFGRGPLSVLLICMSYVLWLISDVCCHSSNLLKMVANAEMMRYVHILFIMYLVEQLHKANSE